MSARAVALLALLVLAGCRGAAEGDSPRVLAERPLPPVLALAVVIAPDQTRVAVSLQGEGLRWLTSDGTAPGPVTRAPERLLAIDLDGDRRDELILGSRRTIEAYSSDALLWRYETGDAPLLGLAAADLTGHDTPTILAAGMPPLGLTAIAADGALAWRETGVRSVLDVTATALPGAEGRAWAVLDTHLVTGYDGIGQRVATLGPTLGAERYPLAPTAVLRLQDQLLVTGRRLGEEAGHWVFYRDDGTPTASGPLPALAAQDRPSLISGRFRQAGETLAVIADGAGSLQFVSAAGEPVADLSLGRPILSLAVQPEVERDRLLVGTATGLVTVGW